MPTSRSFLHLTVDEQVVVCGGLDIRGLLLLRLACRAYCRAVGGVLRRTLELRCAAYVPDPLSLLDTLTSLGGYVAGDIAVAWLLRTPRWESLTLDLYVAAGDFHIMLEELVENQSGVIAEVTEAEEEEDDELEQRAIDTIASVYTNVGIVRVFESSIPDALATIACLHSSVDITYANLEHFGSAYPRLTLARRGLVANWEDGETEFVEKWWSRGVDLRMSARMWPDFGGQWCAASRWSCHAQPRTFWDRGAMRCRMVPLDTRDLRSTVVWRLDYRPCGGSCLLPAAGHGVLGASEKFAVM